MNRKYEAVLSALRREDERSKPDRKTVDESISYLIDNRWEGTPRDFLMILSDRHSDEETMISILRAAEACEVDLYIETFLEIFPDLMKRAARWASIALPRELMTNLLPKSCRRGSCDHLMR